MLVSGKQAKDTQKMYYFFFINPIFVHSECTKTPKKYLLLLEWEGVNYFMFKGVI